ncbi:bifunctional nicotinamidase/pyrazinamidase [Myroides pelagicus]|uniref:nicotinamidase n=1 Tax=Myroides pelagicus TaxID=270914 RepID=A0A7K1GQ95_9FLAO|nr:bifunctional nicotinamidase/pyrazinamidase [Myroides pelagicus]MEC4114163.1 bifunctional nicotinamidase/pyrazinamidase [Myroides pelagicus]MTH31085.1 bifunctional nicotinamidase/pyrazinamidase [Myroides pelagicus]
MKALIVVDLQDDFLPGGSLAVVKGDEIVPVINRLQEKFDLVVATQDWHPANHKSFASQHPTRQVFEVIDLNGLQQVLWPDHCVQGTTGAGFTSAWDSRKVAAIFRKGMQIGVDSYSGFYDNDKQISTGLLGYLRERGVTAVYVCGLAAEFCVYYTSKDAAVAGLDTYFLDFATRPISAEGLVSAKGDLSALGVHIIENEGELTI